MSKNTLSTTYDAHEAESYIQHIWSNSTYSTPEFWKKTPTQNTYTIVVPPPNLTGSLHAGHAFEHFLMDTLIRMARQRGFTALYAPGVDHAGIQLEGVIDKFITNGVFDGDIQAYDSSLLTIPHHERAQQIKKHHTDFYLSLAWKKVDEYRVNQLELARAIGDSPDFNRLLFTLDDASKNMVTYAFESFWKNGLLYKDSYIINWSVALQTALSDVPEDISRQDVTDPFITYRYDLELIEIAHDTLELHELKADIHTALSSLQVGTVRIETAIASQQLMAHPDVIRRLLQEKTSRSDEDISFIIDSLKKRTIVIQYCIPPLEVYGVSLYLEETLDPSFGTGIMKCTPAHDPTDYELAAKHGISQFPMVITKQGTLSDVNKSFSGMNVYVARVKMIDVLIKNGYVHKREEPQDTLPHLNPTVFETLSYQESVSLLQKHYAHYEVDWNYSHSVIICERSKTIVEPLISNEFFIHYTKQFAHTPHQYWKLRSLAIDTLHIDGDSIYLHAMHSDFAEYFYTHLTIEDSDALHCTPFESLEKASEWVDDLMAGNTRKDRVSLVIYEKQTRKQIGYCSIREEDGKHKLTIWIARQHRNNGYGYKALSLFIGWIWEHMNIHVIQWEVKEYNAHSIQLAQKLGFRIVSTAQFTDIHSTSTHAPVHSFHILTLARPLTTLQNLAIEGIQRTQFIPEEYQKRGIDYFAHIKNWCISRDLVWGIKLPIWYNIELNPQKNFYSYQDSHKQITINHQVYQIHELIHIGAEKPTKKGTWEQEQKILDTWFSSTLWPLSVLKFPEYVADCSLDSEFATYYPTQVMTSAWEIFYAWIVRMIMNGMYFTGETPFQQYNCHAWVLDEKGRKMSKSLGNVFDPRAQLEKYSIDSTRLGMLSLCIPGKNMRFQGSLADSLCEKYRNFGNKLWNIARFFEYQFSKDTNSLLSAYCTRLIQDTSEIHSLAVDPASQWIISKFFALHHHIEEAFSTYNFAEPIDHVYKFVWNDFANSYIEYCKTHEAQIPVAYIIFYNFIQLIHPFMPYETEYINTTFFKSPHLLAESTLRTHPRIDIEGMSNHDSSQFQYVIDAIESIRSTKTLFGIDSAQHIHVYVSQEFFLSYEKYFLLTAKAHIHTNPPEKPMYGIHTRDWQLDLDIIPLIENIDDEIMRSGKKLEEVKKIAQALEKTLQNPQFMEKAEQETIMQKQSQLTERQHDIREIQKKISLLTQLSS